MSSLRCVSVIYPMIIFFSWSSVSKCLILLFFFGNMPLILSNNILSVCDWFLLSFFFFSIGLGMVDVDP